MNSTNSTDKVKKAQKPYSFSCSCGHSQRGIAYPSEIRRIWHEYAMRHRRIMCEPRIERDSK